MYTRKGKTGHSPDCEGFLQRDCSLPLTAVVNAQGHSAVFQVVEDICDI